MTSPRENGSHVYRMRYEGGGARVFRYSEAWQEEQKVADFVHGVDAIDYCDTKNAALTDGGKLPDPESHAAEYEGPTP